jgi:acid stress chaperone HdeA
MRASTTARSVLALTTAAVLSLTMSACSGGSAGGDTTCGDFNAMDNDDRRAAVTKMLDDEGDTTSNGRVTIVLGLALAYCQTLGSDSDPISNAYG